MKELTRLATPLGVPSIVVTSQNDSGSTPNMSDAIASEIENAQVTIVPDLQHLGLMEKPHAFTTPVISFFRKLAQ